MQHGSVLLTDGRTHGWMLDAGLLSPLVSPVRSDLTHPISADQQEEVEGL